MPTNHSIDVLRDLDVLHQLQPVLHASLLDVASAFSALVQAYVPHSALVIFTEDCTGRPQKKAGDPAVTNRVTIAELDVVRETTTRAGTHIKRHTATVAAAERPIASWVSETRALLVVVLDENDGDTTGAGAQIDDDRYSLVLALWQLVSLSIRHQVAVARPDYLRDSRMASTERARAIAELTDAHSTTLELILSALRSRDTSDAVARQSAAELATTAMVTLRAVSDRDRSLSEEPVATAFARLRDDLRPLERFSGLTLQFVDPPVNGRALPGEVAHAGRAIVRGAVLALVEQAGVGRVRVQWDCDGSNLLIDIRDDGPGDLSPETPSMRQLSARVTALDGELTVRATAGWGSDISVALPLDAPTPAAASHPEWDLTARERDVLLLVAGGSRNRAIAESLAISENTVKFHVANLLRKVGATNRSELVALSR